MLVLLTIKKRTKLNFALHLTKTNKEMLNYDMDAMGTLRKSESS